MTQKICILLIILISSCNGGEKTDLKISNEFKIEFLNEILSDTNDLKIITSKEQLISNYAMMLPFFQPEPNGKKISHIEYISDLLKINDTVFVKRQIIDNRQLELNQLSKYGFKIFDLKNEIENNTPYDKIFEKVDSVNIGADSYSLLQITKPIFNKEKNMAYIRLRYGSGGKTLILKNVGGKWKKRNQIDDWVE